MTTETQSSFIFLPDSNDASTNSRLELPDTILQLDQLLPFLEELKNVGLSISWKIQPNQILSDGSAGQKVFLFYNEAQIDCITLLTSAINPLRPPREVLLTFNPVELFNRLVQTIKEYQEVEQTELQESSEAMQTIEAVTEEINKLLGPYLVMKKHVVMNPFYSGPNSLLPQYYLEMNISLTSNGKEWQLVSYALHHQNSNSASEPIARRQILAQLYKAVLAIGSPHNIEARENQLRHNTSVLYDQNTGARLSSEEARNNPQQLLGIPRFSQVTGTPLNDNTGCVLMENSSDLRSDIGTFVTREEFNYFCRNGWYKSVGITDDFPNTRLFKQLTNSNFYIPEDSDVSYNDKYLGQFYNEMLHLLRQLLWS